jgi:CTP:molybdopterin cytidylyltransferase MocA
MMSITTIDIKWENEHLFAVRTTLTLDDDILKLAARQAKLRGVSLGRTVSDLLRRGLNASTPAQDKDGLVVFHLPADSPKVTTDDVRRIETEGV